MLDTRTPTAAEVDVLLPESRKLMNRALTELTTLFEDAKMPESHGVDHCLTVLKHLESAIQSGLESNSTTTPLSETKKLSLCLAALLHEVL
ncbi:uncharacterized protein LOC111703118 isoform X2 [Eurytemora carolleeae]|nr:uncharacterized protein LOC111703118 isoform X2 [Eurytemora carolleeae]|eukprot:XP_023330748.1 uncharacterized protein LOC111703118 isoform X2 [Eurytemora affinis]